MFGQHEQVLEVQARPRAERRVGLEIQREAHGLARDLGEQRATGSIRAAQMLAEPRLVAVDLVLEPFVSRELPDEACYVAHVVRAGSANMDRTAGAHGHAR
jgi:hypothetical protein